MTISFFGAIDLLWWAAPFAYIGIVLIAALFIGVPAVQFWPDRPAAAAHAADATAHHDHHEATHSADSIAWTQRALLLPLAAMRVVDAFNEWRDRRRYRNWGNK